MKLLGVSMKFRKSSMKTKTQWQFKSLAKVCGDGSVCKMLAVHLRS